MRPRVSGLMQRRGGRRGGDVPGGFVGHEVVTLDMVGADSDNAKIVVPFESAALLGAAQTLKSVLAATPASNGAVAVT